MASIENKAKECTSLSSSSYPKKYESCYVSYKNTKVSCSLRASSPGKETLQLRLWNLNICIEKVDAKC